MLATNVAKSGFFKQKMKPPLAIALTGLIVLCATGPFITAPMQIATANFFLILTGFSLRKRSRIGHAALTLTGMLSDLALVLTLQFKRDAIQTALAHKLGFFAQAHVYASTMATVLYFPMIYLGVKLFTQNKTVPNNWRLHRTLGILTLIFRTTGYFLMFSMLEKISH